MKNFKFDFAFTPSLPQRFSNSRPSLSCTARRRTMEVAAQITFLPSAVLSRVFSSLDCEEIAACACVCRTWRAAAADNSLWRSAAGRAFPGFRSAPPLPRGTTHRVALAAACRAATSAARRDSSIFALKDFTLAVEVWWAPAGGDVALRPIFATSWAADALHEEPAAGGSLGEASDGAQRQSRVALATAACVLNESESAAREFVKEWQSQQQLEAFSPRVLARRSDGAVAVMFCYGSLIETDTDEDGGVCSMTWLCNGTTSRPPPFFLGEGCRDDYVVDIGATLTVELCGSGRQPSVARFSLDQSELDPPLTPAHLLWALERTVPWARCQAQPAASHPALPLPPLICDASPPATVFSAPNVVSRVLACLDGKVLATCACVSRAWRSAAAAPDSLWSFATARSFPSLFAAASPLPPGITHAASLAAAFRAVALAAWPSSPRASLSIDDESTPFGAASAWTLADFTMSVEVWWKPAPVGAMGGSEVAPARPVFAASFSAQRLIDADADAGAARTRADDIPCELAAGESAFCHLLADASLGDTMRAPHRVARALQMRVMARRADGAVAALYREPDTRERAYAEYEAVCEFGGGGRLAHISWWCIDAPPFYVEPGRRETTVINLSGNVWLPCVDEYGEPRSAAVARFSVSGVTDRVSGLRVTTRDLLWALENTLPWV